MKDKDTINRVKKILERDKMMIPDNYIGLLTSQINSLLSEYMELDEVGAKVRLTLNQLGEYELKIVALADRIKDIPIRIPSLE